MKKKYTKVLCTLACLASLGSGCSDKDAASDGVGGQGGGPAAYQLEKMSAVSQNYAAIVYATYLDSLTAAQGLDKAINDFLDAPSEAALAKARKAWLAAREPYLQSETFRFYDGPIDDTVNNFEGFINSWPLDENFIDYTVDDPQAGIINDPSQEISADALMSDNTQGGEANISTGYHAIEFLLWGQDLSTTGPGNRPFTDYTTKAHSDRRALYLQTVSTLLVSQLTAIADAWAPDADNYRKEFEAAAPEEQLRRILTGMILLSGSETGGDRLQPALDTGDQEDEHSCFSDNTHRDMIQDVQGMLNVYLGTYTTIAGDTVGDGSGVSTIVKLNDSKLDSELGDRIRTSLQDADDLEVPFDQSIVFGNTAGRAKVQALITSLRTKQQKLLEQVFVGAGLTIPQR